MRTSVAFTVGLCLLVGLAAALQADEEPSALDVANRTIREHELTIRLLEKRVRSQELLAGRLAQTLEKEFEALQAARLGTTAGVDVLKRLIEDLTASLELEQERKGLDEDELGKQLMAEQQRHVMDVMHLQGELSRANETAEGNRIQATQSLQRVVVVEDERRRLRDHFVHAVRLLGEIGAPAKIALPWLKQTTDLGDGALGPAAKTALARIEGKPEKE